MLAQNPENEIQATNNLVLFHSKLKLSITLYFEHRAQRFEFFLVALETHENLLHAETQAIAAKHLDTIESILKKKKKV